MRTLWLTLVVCMSCAEQLAPEAEIVAAPVPEAAPVEPASLDPDKARADLAKVIELVLDVGFFHEREQFDGAAEIWHNAFELWALNLRGPLAAADPEAAIAIEYRFGALRTALEARRGKPKPIIAQLEASLRETGWRLTGDPQPAPPTPPETKANAPTTAAPPQQAAAAKDAAKKTPATPKPR